MQSSTRVLENKIIFFQKIVQHKSFNFRTSVTKLKQMASFIDAIFKKNVVSETDLQSIQKT